MDLLDDVAMIRDFSPEELKEFGRKFRSGQPFQHVVIDDFLRQNVFDALADELREYYEENKGKGKTWNTDAEDGKWGSTGLRLPPNLKRLDKFLGSEKLKGFLSKVTGFTGLSVTSNINGPAFSFFHAMKPGAYLGPHTDHTRDLNAGPYHVLNIILYMSEKWDPNWGGGTTLFDKKVRLGGVVEYRPNRALIFMHSPETIHGTERVSDLASASRFSVYYDYYTNDHQPYAHLGLENMKLLDSPHLFYLPKPLMYLKSSNRRYLKSHLAQLKQKILYRFK